MTVGGQSFTFSEIRSVELTKANEDGLVLYPNPASELVYIDLPQAAGENAVLTLRNYLGALLWQHPVEGLSDLTMELGLHDFPSGIYTVTLEVEGQATRIQRLVIQVD